MTRRDALERVLRGTQSASDAGLRPIKINTVLLRGLNDGELEALVERGRAQGWEMRFGLGSRDHRCLTTGRSITMFTNLCRCLQYDASSILFRQ